MFWGNKNDFYFGAKGLLGTFKVSLHKNGIGYVAYHKPFLLKQRAVGTDLAKTALEWRLPVPGKAGAVHVASLILPASYCRSGPLTEKARSTTLVLGIQDNCAAEVGIFLSKEGIETLESKFLKIGHPMFVTPLDNGLLVSIVARSWHITSIAGLIGAGIKAQVFGMDTASVVRNVR